MTSQERRDRTLRQPTDGASNRDEKLIALIADCLERFDAEERQREVLERAERIEYDSLMGLATAERMRELKDVPRPMLRYCQAEDAPGYVTAAESIKALKAGWKPTCFSINAPGLALINFRVRGTPNCVTEGINILGSQTIFTDWTKAIAAASRMHQKLNEAVEF